MNGKKWFCMFLAALLLVFLVWAGLNVFVDPFNAFGDMVFGWDSYTQTLNPRNAKAVYISEHFDDYDSYIIGSSSAASYAPQELNGYLDASFYNMFHYGADTQYDKELVSYLLRSDDVKHIFLVLGLSEAAVASTNNGGLTDRSYYKVSGESAFSYYKTFLFSSPRYALEKLSSCVKDTEMPQTFDVFRPESGCYDKRIRDVEPIGTISAYLEKNGADFSAAQDIYDLQHIDECVENVAEIQQMCNDAGAQLTIVLSPVCIAQLRTYSAESINRYYSQLAQVVNYWNFSISSLTYDERYFYDSTHPRNATGSMVLARIFENETMYRPENFGVFCENGNSVSAEELEAAASAALENPYAATVPVLLYHHLTADGEESDVTLSASTFAHQMDLLSENGYQAVSFDDLIAFVEQGAALPDHPVVITFDDGYLSNYEYGFPALQEHGFPATIFAIGCSIGHKQFYKDTEYVLTPHFGAAEIQEMTASGLISIQSHTYDMHQWAPFEDGQTIRESILPFDSESETDYIAAVTEDVQKQNAVFSEYGLPESYVMAFPGGGYITLTDVILQSCGYKVTVTTDSTRINTLVCGLPQSLIDLGRMNIGVSTSEEDILAYVSAR